MNIEIKLQPKGLIAVGVMWAFILLAIILAVAAPGVLAVLAVMGIVGGLAFLLSMAVYTLFS